MTTNSISEVIVSGDGSRIGALDFMANHRLVILDWETLARLGEIDLPGCESLAAGPDGSWIASASGKRRLTVFDPARLAVSRTFHLDAGVRVVESGPGGRHLLAGCSDGSIRIIEVASGDEVARLDGSAWGPVTSLSVEDDGALILAGTAAGLVVAWPIVDDE